MEAARREARSRVALNKGCAWLARRDAGPWADAEVRAYGHPHRSKKVLAAALHASNLYAISKRRGLQGRRTLVRPGLRACAARRPAWEEVKMANLIIKNGTVVDGTGAKPFAADVRVRGDKITEVGQNLKAAADERVVDAAGCIVAPGFIESHTHFDATMWWQPDMDPLPGYGITTVIMGNCGSPPRRCPPTRRCATR